MKVSREQAVENRNRIIDVASKLFRDKGFDGIGVADLMKAAGLTHGGFYGHFKSKEDLAIQACERISGRSRDKWTAIADGAEADPLEALVKNYVSIRHRDGAESGCLFSSLSSDAGRAGPPVKRVFAAGLQSLVAILERAVPGRSTEAKRRKALATMSQMVGAVILARAVEEEAFSDEILAATIADLTAGD